MALEDASNATCNHSSSMAHTDFPLADSDFVVTLKALACSLVTLVALVGNLLVVIAVYRNPRMRTVTNYLLVNLAVTEFLYITVAMPPFYFAIFLFQDWAQGSPSFAVFCCKFFNFGQYMLLAATVLTLAVIALDQFLAIIKPMERKFTRRVLCGALFLIWLTAAGVAAPVLYAYRIAVYDSDMYCEENWSPAFDTEKASKGYTIVLFVFVYCIPFVAMTTMYAIICHRLWVRRAPGERSSATAKALTETKKKVVKMLVAVLVAFIVSWLPVQVISFMTFYGDVDMPYRLIFVCEFVMRAHPALSPCIYACFSVNFRTGFKDALLCCFVSREKRRAKMARNSVAKTACSAATRQARNNNCTPLTTRTRDARDQQDYLITDSSDSDKNAVLIVQETVL